MKKILISFFIILITIFTFTFNSSVYAQTSLDGSTGTVDDIMSGADSFVNEGESNVSIDENLLGETAGFLYNMLLAFGIITAVIVGSILGIKYMIGSVEEKAEYKQTLLAYLISCVVVFGAFGIWKLVINILSYF